MVAYNKDITDYADGYNNMGLGDIYSIQPDYDEAYYNMGNFLHKQKPDEAIEAYKKSLHQALIMLMKNMGRTRGAKLSERNLENLILRNHQIWEQLKYRETTGRNTNSKTYFGLAGKSLSSHTHNLSY